VKLKTIFKKKNIPAQAEKKIVQGKPSPVFDLKKVCTNYCPTNRNIAPFRKLPNPIPLPPSRNNGLSLNITYGGSMAK